jgi:hypothetical protein
MRFRILACTALALAAIASVAQGGNHGFDETPYGHGARWRASLRPWHGRQYNVQYGAPLALVVPPTAELQTDYTWGVTSSRVTRINHQFQRPWPNGYWSPYGFLPPPQWPSDTRQFGTYYIRGPW